MFKPIYTNKMLKDIELAKKRKLDLKKLKIIISLICESKELPKRCRPHVLSGQFSDCWECHVTPDWLLIYRFTNDEVHFIRTGTHSDLF